jgi:hypothetical protein
MESDQPLFISSNELFTIAIYQYINSALLSYDTVSYRTTVNIVILYTNFEHLLNIYIFGFF